MTKQIDELMELAYAWADRAAQDGTTDFTGTEKNALRTALEAALKSNNYLNGYCTGLTDLLAEEFSKKQKTPPPRLTDEQWRKIYDDYLEDEECNFTFGYYIESAVRKQFLGGEE